MNSCAEIIPIQKVKHETVDQKLARLMRDVRTLTNRIKQWSGIIKKNILPSDSFDPLAQAFNASVMERQDWIDMAKDSIELFREEFWHLLSERNSTPGQNPNSPELRSFTLQEADELFGDLDREVA